MSTLRQPCPDCGRTLELPADAVGRMAKCPACDATFTIAISPEAPDTRDTGSAEPPPNAPPHTASRSPDSRSPEPSPTSGPPQPSYETNPFSAPLGAGTAAGSPQAGYVNPYEPVRAQPVAHVGELPIVSRSIEEIFSPTMTIFGARWAPLILSIVILIVAAVFFIVLPVVVLSALADAGGEAAAGLGLLVGMPFIFFFSAYLWVGLTRVAIAVARDDPSPLRELLPPIKVVMRLIGGGIVIALLILLAVGVFAAILGGLGAAGAPQGIMAALGLLGSLTAVALSLVLQWLLWPWVFVVSDGKGSAIGSIRAAYAVVMHNKLTSLLLIVIATAMSMVGTAACYIGQIVTTPLTLLMFAIAYLLMTDQPIGDPKQFSQTYQPPPNQPTF